MQRWTIFDELFGQRSIFYELFMKVKYYAQFLLGCLYFFHYFVGVTCIFWMQVLWQTYMLWICFSQAVAYHLVFLTISSDEQKMLVLRGPIFQFFLLYFICFVSSLRNLFLLQGQTYFPVFWKLYMFTLRLACHTYKLVFWYSVRNA